MARLGDLIEQIRGVSYKPEDVYEELNENCITLLRANNIQDGQLNFDDVIFVDKKRVRDNQLLKAGDILICTSSGSKGLVGKAAYVQEDLSMTFGAFCKVVRPQRVCSDYLGHFFNSPNYRQKISDVSAGANINNIRNEHIDELEILLPTIERQEYVAVVLDKLSSLISLRKQQLAKLDELVKARFVEMFGDQISNNMVWEQATIGECCELKSGTSLPADLENEGGNIPYVKVGDMNHSGNEYYITTSSRYVTEKTAGKGIFPIGTVIFPKRGGAIGTNKKRITKLPICADLNVMGVIAGDRLLPHYLIAYFEMIDLGSLDNGSSVPQINNKDIAPLMICLPPMEIQKKFSVFVEQTYSRKLTIQQSLDKLEVLKKSLMQEYFW